MKVFKKIMISILFVALPLANMASAGHKDKMAITVWFFSWNASEECVDPRASLFNNGSCFVGDIFTPGPQLSVLHLTGGVTDKNGNITMAGTMYETEPRETPYSPEIDPGFTGMGLMDAQNTEVSLIIRSHGKLVLPRADEQLTTLVDQNCESAGGDRNCVDLFWGIFPVGATETPLYDFISEIDNPTGNPGIYGCASIDRREGAVSVVVHANAKFKKTKWLKRTCGL